MTACPAVHTLVPAYSAVNPEAPVRSNAEVSVEKVGGLVTKRLVVVALVDVEFVVMRLSI